MALWRVIYFDKNINFTSFNTSSLTDEIVDRWNYPLSKKKGLSFIDFIIYSPITVTARVLLKNVKLELSSMEHIERLSATVVITARNIIAQR